MALAPDSLPGPPTGLAAGTITTSTIAVSWVAPLVGPTPVSYKWEYKRRVDPTFTVSSVVTLTGTQTGLAAGTLYDFRVSAVNAVGGASAPSAVFSVSTGTATTLTESAHAASVTSPTGGQLVDAALNVWTLITGAAGRPDFQIAVNGVRQPDTGAVVLMKYYNPVGPAVAGTTKHSVAHQNTAGDWYISTGVSGNIATFSLLSGDPFSATTGGSAGPGLGPAFQDLAGGFQDMHNGQRCSTGMTSVVVDVPGFSGYEIQIKPYVFNGVARPGELGTYLSPVGAAFVDRGRYLWTPDISPIYVATDCPATNPNTSSRAGIRIPVSWWTVGSTVTSPVAWGLFYEPGFDSGDGVVYAVLTDYKSSRGDTFHVTPNMAGRGVVLTKSWGSVLDFSGETSGTAPYGLGWIAFIGETFVKSSILADW